MSLAGFRCFERHSFLRQQTWSWRYREQGSDSWKATAGKQLDVGVGYRAPARCAGTRVGLAKAKLHSTVLRVDQSTFVAAGGAQRTGARRAVAATHADRPERWCVCAAAGLRYQDVVVVTPDINGE